MGVKPTCSLNSHSSCLLHSTSTSVLLQKLTYLDCYSDECFPWDPNKERYGFFDTQLKTISKHRSSCNLNSHSESNKMIAFTFKRFSLTNLKHSVIQF